MRPDGDRRHPELSVVIVTPDRYQTIRTTIRHLRAQTARDRLELVIVAPSADTLQLDDAELRTFSRYCVVSAGAICSIGSANAAGIREATAPVVALAEDHSYPDPGWAEALIAAHAQPWAAVGPVVRNANPNSRISWADLFIAYAGWLDPAAPGVVEHLPGHNSSYKRAILLAYGPALESMLEAESVLHWDLRTKGHQLYLEAGAKTAHVNFTRPSAWIAAQFLSGRVFAASRADNAHWSRLRRLAYAAAAPLIPLVRLSRILRELGRPGRPLGLGLRVLPELALGLTMDGAGQLVGYALGAGDARRRLSRFEFHRLRHAKPPGPIGA